MTAETATQPVRKATRRPSAVVRALLLDSARRTFAAKGYAGASTREIATAAGVHEALIFRHFGNKVNLFRSAVVEPFRQLIDDFVDRWEEHEVPDAMSTDDLCSAWIHSLHALLRDHRDLVVALIAANAFDSGRGAGSSAGVDPDGVAAVGPMTDAFARPLERLERFSRREMRGRGLAGNPTIVVRAMFGMVMSMAVLDDWFFDGVPDVPPAATVTREMTDLMMFGIAGHPPSDVVSGRQVR